MWGLADHEVGANTARAYTRRRAALPATGATLTKYTAVLCRAGFAAASVEQAVAAARVAHRRAGHLGAPDAQGAELVLAEHREALAREGRRAAQAKVLDIDEVRAMLDRCDPAAPAGVCDRVIITVGANLMARRSELSELDIVDVVFTDDGMLVYVRKSKTGQQALGREVAIPTGVHPGSDPVRLTRAWLELLAGHGIETGQLLREAGARRAA